MTGLKTEKFLKYHIENSFNAREWPAVVAVLNALGIQKMSWLDSIKVVVYTALGSIWPHPNAAALVRGRLLLIWTKRKEPENRHIAHNKIEKNGRWETG